MNSLKVTNASKNSGANLLNEDKLQEQLQMAFPRESDLNFPWEKSQWDNRVLR